MGKEITGAGGSTAHIRLPLCLEDITTAWASQEFEAAYPRVKVTSLDIERVIDGTATKVLLKLAYNDTGRAAGLPASMCLKVGLNPTHLEFSKPVYAAEARFYRELAPTIPNLTLPRCYLARTDAVTGQSVILLEDLGLRRARFGDIREEPVSLKVIENLTAWLAILHARYWEDPVLNTFARWPTDKIEGWMGFVIQPENWEKVMAGPRAANVAPELRDRNNIHDTYLAMHRANATQPQCLIHGDLHAGNMYFEPDGTAAFLDWQGIRCGHWAFDLTYFLVTNMTTEDRRKHEKDLLRFYLDRLAVHLAEFQPGKTAPNWDEAWLAYRLNSAHGTGWIAVPTSSQPEEICRLNADRIMTAAMDLDLMGAAGLKQSSPD